MHTQNYFELCIFLFEKVYTSMCWFFTKGMFHDMVNRLEEKVLDPNEKDWGENCFESLPIVS